MTFVKTLWADLVEKRLWPVALVLLLALAAVPVLLGGGGEAAGAALPTGPTGATGAGAETAQVALDAAGPLRRDRLGKLRDPFLQAAERLGTTGATGATGAAAPVAASAGASGGGAPAGAGTSASSPSLPSTGTTGRVGPAEDAPPKANPRDAYTAVLRFGQTGKKRGLRRVVRLSPLPSPESPWFVYLGVTKNEDTVTFLLSDAVKATGDGTCRPTNASCESIELKRGDTEFFDVTDDAGAVTQYQVDLKRIDK